MLVRGRTSRLPGHNEVRYIHGGVATPPPPQSKSHHQLYSVCLVTVPVSCLDTAPVVCLVTVVRGHSTGCFLSHSTCLVRGHSTGCLLSHSTCLVIGHSSRAGGGNPPPGPPHRAPVVCLVTVPGLVLGHSSRAGGGNPPPGTPPSSTPLGAGSQIYLLISKKSRVGWIDRLCSKVANPAACGQLIKRKKEHVPISVRA